MNNNSDTFLETKEYLRFGEFADACRRHRYIGLCHGYPGVGKTLSARHYANWKLIQPYFPERFYIEYRMNFMDNIIVNIISQLPKPITPEILECRSILYTPTVFNTPKRVEQEIRTLRLALSYLVSAARGESLQATPLPPVVPDPTNLIIIDEADRLNTASLEQVRDIYDQGNIGVILIGMPGLEKRLSRYPQLYSRVGFVHEFRSLNAEESILFLKKQLSQWGITSKPESATESEAISAIIRITNGNFRLLHRLLAQIERIANINALRMITKDVVELARQQLVIGST